MLAMAIHVPAEVEHAVKADPGGSGWSASVAPCPPPGRNLLRLLGAE